PGYVGYEEGGQLTERIRRRPYAVVLLDEIEKAHTDVFNMLLQIMEEGRLTDSFGRNVDFKNVIMIMTSNIGADKIMSSDPFGFVKRDEEVNYEKMKDMLVNELERVFRPEFINRIDEVVVFHKLNHEDLLNILELESAKVAKRLQEHGLKLVLTNEAKELLLEKGTDEKFGARPLRRCISSMVEDPLSENILRNMYVGKTVIEVTVEPDPNDEDAKKLKFEGLKAPPEPDQKKKEEEAAAAAETT
ncbi:MAG: AAA family ATPase, partial [Planctomycetes bacterium]|nr:AAA family ATPase [Planctomycetota bacterium]